MKKFVVWLITVVCAINITILISSVILGGISLGVGTCIWLITTQAFTFKECFWMGVGWTGLYSIYTVLEAVKRG